MVWAQYTTNSGSNDSNLQLFFSFHSNDIENYLRLNPLIPFFGLIQVSNSP